jgi:23S rRNA (uridine2552-2'-O)-methyltransferase
VAERWVQQRRQDAYWKRAKREGYRSRAAYKLRQIQERYQVLRKGDRVVDLGCAPGGWTQAALEIVGDGGAVVGVDLDRVRPLAPAVFVRGDMTQPETLEELREALGGRGARADAVISDMAPNISGMYSVDQARSVRLARMALKAAQGLLRPGGAFVAKVFEGEDFAGFLEEVRGAFGQVRVHAPPASRKESSEVYVVAKAFRGGKDRAPRPRPEEE